MVVTRSAICPTCCTALMQSPRGGNRTAVLLERILVHLTRLETVQVTILFRRVMVLTLTLPVRLTNPSIIMGRLLDIPVVSRRKCRSLLQPEYMPTVVLERIQSGCINMGNFMWLMKVRTLLNAASVSYLGRPTLRVASTVENPVSLLVPLTLAVAALRTGMRLLLSPIVRPPGTRLLAVITILQGYLSLTTLTICLKASLLKQRWLYTLQLADIALGPQPTTIDWHFRRWTARSVRMLY